MPSPPAVCEGPCGRRGVGHRTSRGASRSAAAPAVLCTRSHRVGLGGERILSSVWPRVVLLGVHRRQGPPCCATPARTGPHP